MQRFPALNPEKTIVILPVATIVQRRPHLPVMTDSALGEAMLPGLQIRLPAERSALVRPIQAIGKSNEYLLSRGAVSLSAGPVTCACRHRRRRWCWPRGAATLRCGPMRRANRGSDLARSRRRRRAAGSGLRL
jgi:hypothetical protein